MTYKYQSDGKSASLTRNPESRGLLELLGPFAAGTANGETKRPILFLNCI